MAEFTYMVLDEEMNVVSSRTIDPSRCQFTIFTGEHYREDGSGGVR